MLGGLLFGIATFRAGIVPHLPADLLALAVTLTPLAALLPHAERRYAAIPVALALPWLGYALFTEQRASASEAAPRHSQRATSSGSGRVVAIGQDKLESIMSQTARSRANAGLIKAVWLAPAGLLLLGTLRGGCFTTGPAFGNVGGYAGQPTLCSYAVASCLAHRDRGDAT
jgi:hypothetical protein